MKQMNDLDPEMLNRLSLLKQVPERNSQHAFKGKQTFLDQAASYVSAVSPSEVRRHNHQNNKNSEMTRIHRKELRPMFSTLTSIILAISLLLGGGGVTVAAAQASNPGDLLYDVKLLSEDALMTLTTNPDSQVNLSMDLVERRYDEIIALLETGSDPSNTEIDRLRQQIEETIVLALKLPEVKAILAFEQLQTRLQIEDQKMSQIKTNGSESAIQVLFQTHSMIQERIQILETGQMNLLQMKEQLHIMEQTKNQVQTSQPSAEDNGAGQGNQPEITPQSPNNGNPQENGNGTNNGTDNGNETMNNQNSNGMILVPGSLTATPGSTSGTNGFGGNDSSGSQSGYTPTRTPTPKAGNTGRTGGTSGGR